MERSTREMIIETVNRLFIYTDNRQWDLLQSEVFTPEVAFDMSSMGGPQDKLASKAICDSWAEGFKDLDAINHLAGNYLVTVEQSSATVFAYATATHYKAAARNGQTREFVGTYDIGLILTTEGWRIDAFRYQLKYASGNRSLE